MSRRLLVLTVCAALAGCANAEVSSDAGARDAATPDAAAPDAAPDAVPADAMPDGCVPVAELCNGVDDDCD
ncbi:MAG: hypothetical protein KC464_25620, partial [Myxococcales bacterium]|nr:hypothetical protein [Myxococcales bacterium]